MISSKRPGGESGHPPHKRTPNSSFAGCPPANYKSELIKEEVKEFIYKVPSGYENYVAPILEDLDKKDYVEDLEVRLDSMRNHTWDSIDKVMKAIAKEYAISPRKLHDDFKSKNGMIPDRWVNRNKTL